MPENPPAYTAALTSRPLPGRLRPPSSERPDAAPSPPFARSEELALLHQAWVQTGSTVAAAYVEGPPGVGKSVVITHFAEDVRDRVGRIIRTVARRVPASPDAILGHLTQAVGREEISEDGLAALNRAGRTSGVVWIVEGYDAWRPVDPWFRAEMLGRLGPGVFLILESREPVQRLWAGDLAAQARVRRVPIEPWDDRTVEAYLGTRGVDPEWIPVARDIVSGSPALAVRIADAIAADRALIPQTSASRTGSFLLERALHPGSRRMAWRAGFADSSLDTLVAAATLLPVFTRHVLRMLVRHDVVETHWTTLTELPLTVTYGPGVYGFRPSFRRAVIPLVEEARPWAARQWRWHALEWAIRGEEAVGASVVAERIAAEGLARCMADPNAPTPVLGGITWSRSSTDADAGRVDLPATTLYVLDADKVRVLWARGSFPPPGDRDKRLRLDELQAAQSAPDAEPLAWGAVLARAAAVGGIEVGVPLAGRMGRWLAGSRQNERLEASAPELRAHLLETARDVLFGPRVTAGPDTLVAMVRQALGVLNQPDRLVQTDLAAHWPGRERPTAGALRRWILDALTSADLGDFPSGRLVLSLYYVERRGSHEALAERLNVSRATYFRSHQRALKRLAECLLSPPPGSNP
jgi:hypothetical protein